MSKKMFIGLDLGTGGARALAVNEEGAVGAAAEAPLPDEATAAEGKHHEQDAEAWWSAARTALQQLAATLQAEGIPGNALGGLAVDATSGTFVPVDASGAPQRPGLMYNDGRAGEVTQTLRAAADDHLRRHGFGLSSSWAVAKMHWLCRHEPEVVERSAWFVHQADFLVGRLTGRWAVTDHSNALKSGCDLFEGEWAAWLENYPEIAARLPALAAPGTAVGALAPGVAARLGLPEGLPVVAGATDGTAGFLASGAQTPGALNVSLGTTLIFKMLSDTCVFSADGAVYSHRLGPSIWLPGAASNAGGGALEVADPAAADRAASPLLPVPHAAYPLVGRGERFPLPAPEAEAFCAPEASNANERHAALLQGVALVERMGMERLECAAPVAVPAVYSTGAGSRSDIWMQLRADALQRPLHRPAVHETALGAAILAARGTHFDSLPEAVGRMTRIEATFEPDAARGRVLKQRYDALLEELRKRPEWPDPAEVLKPETPRS